MRKGLILGALLATMMIGGTAMADRSDSDDRGTRNSRNTKQMVLEKQKEGFGSSKAGQAQQRSSNVKQSQIKENRSRPKGEVYGDQAGRSSGKTRATQASGKNLSASNRVNTPSEIRAMLRMINPLMGAYRTSQAAEGTDSYGGADASQSRIPNGQSASGNGKSRNMSATGKINTPSEAKQFMAMINPMLGAYRTSQAAEGTDSYGGGDFAYSKFKNGQQTAVQKGSTDVARKSTAMREQMVTRLKEKVRVERTKVDNDPARKANTKN